MREAQGKGPGSFPLERLISIFNSLLKSEAENRALKWFSVSFQNLVSGKTEVVNQTNEQPPPGKGKKRGRKRKSEGNKKGQSEEFEEKIEPFRGHKGQEEVTGEALVQLATLVSSGFVGRTGEEVLSGGAVFWCRAGHDFVTEVKSL